jgi:hypothetical protein
VNLAEHGQITSVVVSQRAEWVRTPRGETSTAGGPDCATPRRFRPLLAHLMKASIVQAAEGDRDEAKRAQVLGAFLIELHR